MTDMSAFAASWAAKGAHPLSKKANRKSPNAMGWQQHRWIDPPERIDASGWPGMCIPMGGKARIEGIEFDADEEKDEHGVKNKVPGTAQAVFSEYVRVLKLVSPDLLDKVFARGYVEQSPSGGIHVFIQHRAGEVVPGNEKWARYKSGKTKIETRGDGGQFVVAPTPGYTALTGMPHQVPQVTQAERGLLKSLAGTLSEKVVMAQPKPDHEPDGVAYVSGRGWTGVFAGTGWTEAPVHASNLAAGFDQAWARPGHEPSEESGEYSAVSSRAVLMVFSSTAMTELEDLGYGGREKANGSRTYTQSEVYAAYNDGASLYADDQREHQEQLLGIRRAVVTAPGLPASALADSLEERRPRPVRRVAGVSNDDLMKGKFLRARVRARAR